MTMRKRMILSSLCILLWAPGLGQRGFAQTTGIPSKFCHVTDGAFTACPVAGVEWSDVPVLAFPESHSFLYADQANLDPTLSSPYNTLTLMYDECGRTKPLGRSEYVLVNFKTVEQESGTEQLKNYVVHLFADSTIIFIENGVVKPQIGRAHV